MNISLQLISYQDWMIGERSRFVGELDTDGDGHLNDDEVINYLHLILSLHLYY